MAREGQTPETQGDLPYARHPEMPLGIQEWGGWKPEAWKANPGFSREG